MCRWLRANAPALRRIAFAGKLIQRVPNRKSGYNLLGRYLHDVGVDPESMDFQYRVNRKRLSRSGIQGLFINRLTTWTVAKFTVQATARLPGTTTETVSAPTEVDVCALDLDINTVHEFPDELPQHELQNLFQELTDLGAEIARCGDIR